MFDVDRSSDDWIVVRDYFSGQCWTFVVVAQGSMRSLALQALAGPGQSRTHPLGKVQHAVQFAEVEAWKRGMID